MLRIYWQAQYARVGQIEDQRLQFSNFVVGASVVAIGVTVASSGGSAIAPALMAAAVSATNLIAFLYSRRCNLLARMHGARARQLVAEYWPEIGDLADHVDGPDKAQFGSTSYFGSAVSLHQYLHFVLILTAIGVAIAGTVG